MSLNKGATRRVALLTNASLIVSGLAMFVSAGAVLTPTGTFAQTCTPTPATVLLTGPDTVACTAGSYPAGIVYTSNGDLAVDVQRASTFGAGGGVQVTAGQLNDNIDVELVGTGTFAGNSMPVPILFDLQSQAGDITFATPDVNVQVGNAATTHGVRATSTSGDININIRRSLTAGGITGVLGPNSGTAAVQVTSTAGGNVTVASGSAGSGGVQGRLYGVLASTTGGGTLTINGGAAASATDGVAAISATTGTGLLTINTGAGGVNGGAGSGALINAGGDVLFTGVATGSQYGVRLTTVAGGTADINVTGLFERLNDGPTANFNGGVAAIRATGGGTVNVNVLGGLQGGLDFTGLATVPNVTVAAGGNWVLRASGSILSAQGAAINVEEGGAILLGRRDGSQASETIAVSFSGANDVINNAGLIDLNPVHDSNETLTIGKAFEGEARLEGLEEFNNSGLIVFGTFTTGSAFSRPSGISDLDPDDLLSMPGARYVGQDGRMVLDVNLNAGSTTSCSAANRDALGDMAADCLAIVGGSTEGTTYVTLRDGLPGDRGAYNPDGIVLVDVAGGTGAQGDFLLAEDSDGYSPLNGGMIDKGAFAYLLAWDGETQQHKLVGLPSGNTLQMALLPSVSHSLWRTSTGTWLDRQADLRGNLQEGVGGGVWLRVATEFVDRDAVQFVSGGGQTFGFDNTLTQNSYAVTGGFDLLSGVGGDTAYVVGVMAGYAHADVEYQASPNKARLDGASLGGYASFMTGGLFVDAAVNVNRLDLEQDVPAYDLFPVGTLVSSKLMQTGFELQAGWRLPFSSGMFVEPLVGVSYVKSSYDDVSLVSDDPARPGVDASFDDPASLRASLGGRFALAQDYGVVRAQYSVLGRVWNEFEGETTVTLLNIGPDAVMTDDFSGQFNELGFGASVYSAGGVVSGFLNVGGKFGDDYKAQTASAGVRVNW